MTHVTKPNQEQLEEMRRYCIKWCDILRDQFGKDRSDFVFQAMIYVALEVFAQTDVTREKMKYMLNSWCDTLFTNREH